MIGNKKSILKRQCHSKLKMGIGSSICGKLHPHISQIQCGKLSHTGCRKCFHCGFHNSITRLCIRISFSKILLCHILSTYTLNYYMNYNYVLREDTDMCSQPQCYISQCVPSCCTKK